MDFIQGEVLLVDKPYGWTSFDAVNKLRWHLKRHLKVKKIKVGHAGTLDPLATGLLVICTGKKTKMVEAYMAEEKTYTGTFLLGKTTPSFDLETAFDHHYPIEPIDPIALDSIAESFLGMQQQIPPVYSAKQIDGKRAYELAREGKAVEMKANTIEIKRFHVDGQRFPEIDFEITCSKGTYIRSLARDFGLACGSGATLMALRRTHSGNFSVAEAKTVEAWIEAMGVEHSAIP
jgi:tRNA pseudouridine55 synthase